MLRDCGRNFFGIFFGNVLTSSGIHQFSFLSDQLSLFLHQSIHKYLEVFGKWIFALLCDQDGEGEMQRLLTTSQGGLVKRGPISMAGLCEDSWSPLW